MPLQPGSRIGPYQVTAPLGAGGMGVVWRAHDTRLERDVALKALPPELAASPDRVARLTREARLLASLSHPHIAAVHGLEEEGGEHVLVLELVEGPTLAERMARGRLPLEDALGIARQVAEALEAAHEKGVVHRDLKPANVALSRDGGVKLLDFGLARALASEPGDVWETPADATTQSASEAAGGVVHGTARYMSPEQALGKPVDRRADVWAFGVVLFEMLAGERLFEGETGAEILASVLRQEIDFSRLPPGVPASVRHLLERCLVRDPRERMRDIREARVALEEKTLQREVGERVDRDRRRRIPPRARTAFAAAVALVLLAAGVAGSRVLRGPAGQVGPRAVRFDVEVPRGMRLPTRRHEVDISPDGNLIVFSAVGWTGSGAAPGPGGLFVRAFDEWDARPLPGGEDGRNPVISPDGRWVAFLASRQGMQEVKKLPLGGGTPSTLCSFEGAAPIGLTWAGEGALLFGSVRGPLMRVEATGGKPEAVTHLDDGDGELSHRLPHALPDGRTVFYTAVRDSRAGLRWEQSRIYAQRIGAGERTLLVEEGSDGRWSPPGVLLFAREGALLAARLSPDGLSLASPPIRLIQGVRHAVWSFAVASDSGAAQVAVSRDGSLVYAAGTVDPEHPRVLVWVEPSGREVPIDRPAQSYVSVNLSPDGRHLLSTHNFPGRQVELVDLARGTTRNVTFEGTHREAVWGPGPGEVTFDSDHEGPKRIYVRRLDAPPGEMELLWKGAEELVAIGSWSPDGRRLCIQVGTPRGDDDILEVSREGNVSPLVATRLHEAWPVISPDGKWLAYAGTNEPERTEVFIRPLAASGAPSQASVGGAKEPLWARDGKAVFYKSPIPGAPREGTFDVYRVRVTDRAGRLELSRPEKLFEGLYGSTARGGRNWDVAADGRFLLDRPPVNADLSTYEDAIFLTRLRVDLGGVPALMEGLERRK